MISYAQVDRIEKDANDNQLVVMMVERVSIYSDDRNTEAFEENPTFTTDVPISMFWMKNYVDRVEEGEVFSVYHDNGKVERVLRCEPGERERRRQRLKALEEE